MHSTVALNRVVNILDTLLFTEKSKPIFNFPPMLEYSLIKLVVS